MYTFKYIYIYHIYTAHLIPRQNKKMYFKFLKLWILHTATQHFPKKAALHACSQNSSWPSACLGSQALFVDIRYEIKTILTKIS